MAEPIRRESPAERMARAAKSLSACGFVECPDGIWRRNQETARVVSEPDEHGVKMTIEYGTEPGPTDA